MKIIKDYQRILFYRERIPQLACRPGCHDCCGPVMAPSMEVTMLPSVPLEQRQQALDQWSCPHLGENGCMVYEDRPLTCRLMGVTKKLPCPQGVQPDRVVPPLLEGEIFDFLRSHRRVLL